MIVAIARVWGQAQLFQSIMNQVNRANLEDWISGRLDYKTLAEEANAIFQQSSAKPIAKYYSKDKILYSKLFLHNRDKFTIAITHGTKIHTYEGIFRYQWDGDVVCYFKIEGIEHSNEPEYLSCTTGTTYICMSGGFELCSWNFDDMLRYDRSQLDSSSLC